MTQHRPPVFRGSILLGALWLGACSLPTPQGLPPTPTFSSPSRELLGNGARGVGHRFEETYPRAVANVTAEDVQRVANLYLRAPAIVRLEPSPT
jgi:hypothetical protein